jgi:hypothetical protein
LKQKDEKKKKEREKEAANLSQISGVNCLILKKGGVDALHKAEAIQVLNPLDKFLGEEGRCELGRGEERGKQEFLTNLVG